MLPLLPQRHIHAERPSRVETAFPEGESLRDVIVRVRGFLDDLARDRDGKRVAVIGHGAPRLALDHLLDGLSLEEAASERFAWQPEPPSWQYVLDTPPCP